jgi:hypothetical protein
MFLFQKEKNTIIKKINSIMTITPFQTESLRYIVSYLNRKRIENINISINVDNDVLIWRDDSDKLINLIINEKENVTLSVINKNEGKSVLKFSSDDIELKKLLKIFIRN